MYEMLKEGIKPELFVLIPVLYLVGIALKNSKVADKNIPWMLGVFSILLCFLFIGATADVSTWKDIVMAIFSSVTQGILCAGASVYFNQLIVQKKKAE